MYWSSASQCSCRARPFRAGIISVLFWSAAGCVQGPDYSRPAIEVPAEYRFSASAGATHSASPTEGWWRGMRDPQLDSLVREALAKNTDLKVATARVDEFTAILMGTKSQAFPQIGYDVSGGQTRLSEHKVPAFVNPLSTSFSAVLTASWEIDLWGRIRRETEAARANLFATEEARRGVILTLISSVVSSYVTLLDLDERLRIAEATLQSRGEWVRLFRARLNRGYISDFEMTQAQAEYEATAAAIPDLKQAIATQENALSVLLGRNPGPIARDRTLDTLSLPPVPASLPSELLVQRPDILQAEQTLIASNALIGAARALYFPRITLTGFAGFASAALKSLFSGPSHTWQYTGDVAGPIFTGGGIKAANRQAEARRDQSLALYQKAIQNAFRDVDDSLAGVQNSDDRHAVLGREVQSLQEGVRLATLRYDNGYADYLTVLDTERGLYNAQLSLTQAQGDRYRAVISLHRALGGDWLQPHESARQ